MDEELKIHLEGMEARIGEQTRAAIAAAEERMAQSMRGTQTALEERMRDMQTELLRGFESFANGQNLRLRKVEADQSNPDASLSGRISTVEQRLQQIELRLGLAS